VREDIIVNSVISTLTSDPISLQAIDVINEKVTDDTSLTNSFSGLNIKVILFLLYARQMEHVLGNYGITLDVIHIIRE